MNGSADAPAETCGIRNSKYQMVAVSQPTPKQDSAAFANELFEQSASSTPAESCGVGRALGQLPQREPLPTPPIVSRPLNSSVRTTGRSQHAWRHTTCVPAESVYHDRRTSVGLAVGIPTRRRYARPRRAHARDRRARAYVITPARSRRARSRAPTSRRTHSFLRVGGMNPLNQIVILLPGQFRMQNSKPIPSGA